MVINKIDLPRHIPLRMDLARENARRTNPRIEIIATSCSSGAGLGHWMNWLAERSGKKNRAAASEVVDAV
jgi:hydrogenase nickel incorporation protein HypB